VTDSVKILDPDNLTDEQKALLGKVKHDYSKLRENCNEKYFDFALTEYDLKENNEVTGKAVAERAFFKDYKSAQEYFKSIDFIDYICFQYEKGKSGNFHLQGFMHYKRQTDFSTVKEIFPTIHLDKCNGSNNDCREYCMKTDDTKVEGYDFFEDGDIVEERQRTDMEAFSVDVQEMTKLELHQKYPGIMLNRWHNVDAIQHEYRKKKFMGKKRELHITYIYGKERAGKSTYPERVLGYELEAVSIVGEYNTTGMFDEYEYHDIIVFDEFDSQIEITKMNKWLDGRPCTLPARMTNKIACYTKIFVISNYPLDHLYMKARKAGKEPSYRGFVSRFNEIIYMPERNTHIWRRGKPTESVIKTLTEQGAKYEIRGDLE